MTDAVQEARRQRRIAAARKLLDSPAAGERQAAKAALIRLLGYDEDRVQQLMDEVYGAGLMIWYTGDGRIEVYGGGEPKGNRRYWPPGFIRFAEDFLADKRRPSA